MTFATWHARAWISCASNALVDPGGASNRAASGYLSGDLTTFTARDRTACVSPPSLSVRSTPLVTPEAELGGAASGNLSPHERADVLGLVLVLIVVGLAVAMAGAKATDIWMEVAR